jgi:hypothetical protein
VLPPDPDDPQLGRRIQGERAVQLMELLGLTDEEQPGRQAA